MEKDESRRLLAASIGLIVLIWIAVPLLYKNKFWGGLSSILSLPILFGVFLVDNLSSKD